MIRKAIGRLIEFFLSYPHTVMVEAMSPYSEHPKSQYQGDAGYDMYCTEQTVVPALGYANIPTHIKFEMPKGLFVLIKGRSSSLKNKGLIVTDSVIDNGYRGEMFASVYNTKDHDVIVGRYERVAQVVPFRLIPLKFKSGLVGGSGRGICGFGSSG